MVRSMTTSKINPRAMRLHRDAERKRHKRDLQRSNDAIFEFRARHDFIDKLVERGIVDIDDTADKDDLRLTLGMLFEEKFGLDEFDD